MQCWQPQLQDGCCKRNSHGMCQAVCCCWQEYSDWPTYPQLYANGELVGGCDIVLELHDNHQLKQTLEDALGPAEAGQQALHARLKKLISSSSVMLFMKVRAPCLCQIAITLFHA